MVISMRRVLSSFEESTMLKGSRLENDLLVEATWYMESISIESSLDYKKVESPLLLHCSFILSSCLLIHIKSFYFNIVINSYDCMIWMFKNYYSSAKVYDHIILKVDMPNYCSAKLF